MNKVCFINLVTYSSTGGIEKYNQNFLRVLDDLNIKTTVLSIYDKTNEKKYQHIEFKNFSEKKISASTYLLKNVYKIETLIVAHINLLPIAILSKIMNPKLNIYILLYGIEVWKKFPYFYRLFFEKVKFLSISSYTTNIFLKLNTLTSSNMYYSPPSIDIDIGLNNELGNYYNKQEFNILSVTRLSKADDYKGIDNLINIIPLLIKTIPNLKLTIIGKGNDKKRLMQLSIELKVDCYIDFKGFIECIEPYYRHCDVFALPSKGEGFGIVYLEAMKYKKPCIACDEGGQTDVVIDNKTGFLCKYDDAECLSKKIIKLFKDRELSDKFGENGYEHLVNNFTFDKFKNRLNGILSD